MDILDLPGLVVVGRTITDDDKTCIFKAETTTEVQKACEKCGTVGKLYSSGPRNRTYRDSPIRKRHIVISLKILRFKCRSCGHTFAQRVDGMDPTRHMTTRCVEWIREQCLRDTFAHVAEQIGCNEKTVRDIAHTYIDELKDTYPPYLPEWLGIDEIWLGGRYRCVLTDIGEHRPIDLLKDRKKMTLAGWLWNFREDCDHLKGVTMDMTGNFKQAVHSVFKEVPIVVDRFHVVKMANAALDEVRNKVAKKRNEKDRKFLRGNKGLLRAPGKKIHKSKSMQQELDRLLDAEPEIQTAYVLKEQFSRLFDLKHRHEAEIALKEWRGSVPENMQGHFKGLLTATKNWKMEILAYFDHLPRRTNGYTEELNSKIKADNRLGGGYGFDVLRARILFARPTKKIAAVPIDDIPVSKSTSA